VTGPGLPSELLGVSLGTDVRVLDKDVCRAYALATNDPNPQYLSGELARPMTIVIPGVAAAMDATEQLLTAEMVAHTVEASHDIYFLQPLVPGIELHTVAVVHAVRNRRAGDRLTLRIDSRTPAGGLVTSQLMTMAVRGLTGSVEGGPDLPGHRFPEVARDSPVGQLAVAVDEDQTYRYRDASGDDMRIHVDDDFARSVGLPGMIVHGFCTMAMCSRSVIGLAASGDASRLRRLAVRFAAFVRPGSSVETSVFSGTDRAAYHFEATADGVPAIADGAATIS
jgi:acyl dehydratase